jgi:hypothetical protein
MIWFSICLCFGFVFFFNKYFGFVFRFVNLKARAKSWCAKRAQ